MTAERSVPSAARLSHAVAAAVGAALCAAAQCWTSVAAMMKSLHSHQQHGAHLQHQIHQTTNLLSTWNENCENIPWSKHTHTHTRLTALFPGIPRWAGTRKVKRIWILLKQETVSGSGISWAICKSAPRSRQITMPAPHCSVFYRPDALPAAQPTVSKHWRHIPWSKTE